MTGQTSSTAAAQPWDATRYDRDFSYVSALGGGVVDVLDPQPGETVLDLGCGTGELSLRIRERGASVIAMDSDPAMVAAATRRLGEPAVVVDGHDFTVDEPVDAVFSNAALHWMTSPEKVVRRVRAALRDGGRFAAEMGGAGNVAHIVGAVRTALAERGLADGMAVPWYFPTVGEYAGLLEANGFRVAVMQHFARPTELADCARGVPDWVAMFGSSMLSHVDAGQRPDVLERVGELTQPVLFRDGRWYADYVRLRFIAVAEDRIGFPPA